MADWGQRARDALLHPSWIWRRCYWSWIVRRRPPSIHTLATANGLISFDTRDQTIGRALYIKRQYEMELIHRAMRTLRADGFLAPHPAGCVIDVGANIGIISIALIKERYFANAIALEPDSENFALLEHNVAQNDLGHRIRCVNRAVSNRTGTLALARSSNNWGGHFIQPGAELMVQAGTLDELAAGEPVSLIWIDVEGYEALCFEGARRLLAQRIPVVSEFWADGLARAGTTAARYTALTSELFTHFYSGDPFTKHPIADIPLLFERLPREREHNIILVSSG